jgi:ribosomal protein S18 acetylase RimI-like enzyme
MTVDIRDATPEDASDMQRVAEQAWYEAHAPIIGEDTTAEFLEQYYDSGSLRNIIEDPGWITAVADTGEAVVGFTSGGPDEDEAGLVHLGRVYVTPAQWGNGIGKQLLDAFERRAAEFGDRISLRVMAENERAVRFYDSAGYDRQEEIYDENVETTSYVYVKEI